MKGGQNQTGYEPKGRPEEAMLERRRRAPGEEEAEDEAEKEVEVLKGGRQKALEDEKSEKDEKKEVEEDQVVMRGGEGAKSRGGEFLRTPDQPALEEGVRKTSDEEETSAKKIEEWKTPKTMRERARSWTNSTNMDPPGETGIHAVDDEHSRRAGARDEDSVSPLHALPTRRIC